jgi:cytochrome c
MIGGGMALVGLWTMPFQPAARETTLEASPRPPSPAPSPQGNSDEASRTEIFDSRPTPDIPKSGGPAIGDQPSGAPENFDPKVVAVLVGKADLEQGARLFRMCEPCHGGANSGPNRLGPNLWGIFDRPVATQPNFNYSNALRIKGGTWTDENLAEYLHNPRNFAPGTSMAFVGIKDNARLTNLVAYLRTLSDRPTRAPK